MNLLDYLETAEFVDDTEPDFDIYQFQEEERKLINKENRKRERIAQCGTWIYYRNPNTGLIQTGVFKCGYWRNGECPKCSEERAKFFKGNMVNYISQKNNNVGLIKSDEETITKIVRKVRDFARKEGLENKGLYERFPTTDKDYLFLDSDIADKLGIKMNKISTVDILSMNWNNISCLTEGRNKSGNMSQPTPEKTDHVLINVEEFSTDANPDLVKALELKVIEQTQHYNPKTAEDVEKYLKNRTYKLKKALEKAGYKITFRTYGRKKCQILCINWLKATQEFLQSNGVRCKLKTT